MRIIGAGSAVGHDLLFEDSGARGLRFDRQGSRHLANSHQATTLLISLG